MPIRARLHEEQDLATEPFVPEHRDSVYADDELPPSRPWRADRPGEVSGSPDVVMFGAIGPDAGYIGRLAAGYMDRIVAGVSNKADLVAGAEAIAMRRASVYGRAPIGADLEVGLLVLGAFEGAPGDWSSLQSAIAVKVRGMRYPPAKNRAVELADSVDRSWLDLDPDGVRERLSSTGPATIFA